jgi:hypothetical protein
MWPVLARFATRTGLVLEKNEEKALKRNNELLRAFIDAIPTLSS